MTAALDVPVLRRVAVVDDDEGSRFMMARELRRAGYDAVMPSRESYSEARELAHEIRSFADGAVCDHRLQEGSFAVFEGARLVAELYQLRFPALLVTDWARVDADGPIRMYRRHIPVLLRTEDASPATIRQGLASCVRELEGDTPPERKPRPAIVIVEGQLNVGDLRCVEAYVPQWHSHEAVRFPLDLLRPALRDQIGPGMLLRALVNIGAERAEDLFFDEFELAQEDVGPYDG
jgi:hypothetical protein